jgi:hypothetical protein
MILLKLDMESKVANFNIENNEASNPNHGYFLGYNKLLTLTLKAYLHKYFFKKCPDYPTKN